jgi:tripartite-type tricarboxylate transporter receptor subunit TctC
MRRHLGIGRFVLAMMCAVLPLSTHAAEFYQGKSLSVLVNFTAGGPTDVEARLLARHLARHIPGVASVVVRNMGGAAGVVGANWLGEVAPPDGLTLGYLKGSASKSAIGEAALRVDLSKFAFIAGGPGVQVTYIRGDVAPGIHKPADLLKASGFWAGGLSPEADKDLRERMALDMLGLSYHYISNYPGSAEARMALERNEIQMFSESMPTYRASIEPNLVKNGLVIPLWSDALDDGDTFSLAPEAEGIPATTFPGFLKELGRAPPKGDMWDAFRLVNSVGTVFLRVIVLPPGSPPEAIAALRAAFTAVNDDPDYRADALATMKFIPRYVTDERTAALYREKLKPDPRLRDFLRAYVEEGRARLGK